MFLAWSVGLLQHGVAVWAFRLWNFWLLLAILPSLWHLPVFGTVCCTASELRRYCQSLKIGPICPHVISVVFSSLVSLFRGWRATVLSLYNAVQLPAATTLANLNLGELTLPDWNNRIFRGHQKPAYCASNTNLRNAESQHGNLDSSLSLFRQ